MNRKFGLRAGSVTIFLSVLLAACSGSKDGSSDKKDNMPRIEASQAGLDAFVKRLQGKQIRLYRGNGTYSNLSIYIDEDGFLYNCTEHEPSLEECLSKENRKQKLQSLQMKKNEGGDTWCLKAEDPVNEIAHKVNEMGFYLICVSNYDRVLHGVATEFPVQAGAPFFAADFLSQKENGLQEEQAAFVFSDSEISTAAQHVAEVSDADSLADEKDRVSYAIGMAMGKQLSQIKDEIDVDATEKGLSDKFNGEKPLVDEEKGKELMEAFGRRMQAKGIQATEDPASASTDASEGDLDINCMIRTQKVKEYDSAAQSGNAAAVAMLRALRGLQRDACDKNGGGGPDSSSRSQNPPNYPPEEQRLGIEGTTVLAVGIDSNGAVLDVTVEESSGNQNLDREAVRVAGLWRYNPTIIGGKKVASRVRVPIVFKLEGNAASKVELARQERVDELAKMQAEYDRVAEERRQLEEERRNLEIERDKVAQMKQDEAQRRDGCETFRTVMENEVRKGNLTAADLAAGMKDRGCVGNN